MKLGEIQTLEVKNIASVGAFLNLENPKDNRDVLLPNSQLPKGLEIGDYIEVFIYKDHKDRLISTTNRPKITLGNLAKLEVIDINKIGIFLDWGLERDLFMPYAETVGSLEKGKSYLVGMYIDKSNRLSATMKIKDMLSNNHTYKENDIVKGTIYSINHDIGLFIAVDNKYDGMIPIEEVLGVYEVGDTIESRVSRVLEDGKLDLTLKNRSYIQMEEDADLILLRLKENNGRLNLNDNSSPSEIRNELKISKSAFKRAVGMLLRKNKIKFKNNGIELK